MMIPFRFTAFLFDQLTNIDVLAQKSNIPRNSLRRMKERGTVKTAILQKFIDVYGSRTIYKYIPRSRLYEDN